MKKIFFLLLIFTGLTSCKCKKATAENGSSNKTVVLKDCWANAKCTLRISKDTMIHVEKDGIGKLNLLFDAQSGMTSYHYIASENQDEQYMDGGYREEIAFQLPSDFKDGTISGKQFSETKAIFGVFCYCKEKAGYYAIKQGTITKAGATITVEIPVLVEGQKVRSIRFDVL